MCDAMMMGALLLATDAIEDRDRRNRLSLPLQWRFFLAAIPSPLAARLLCSVEWRCEQPPAMAVGPQCGAGQAGNAVRVGAIAGGAFVGDANTYGDIKGDVMGLLR